MSSNKDEPNRKGYAYMYLSNYLHVVTFVFSLPFSLILNAIRSTCSSEGAYRNKPVKRRIGDTVARSVFNDLTPSELQWALGTGDDVYKKWTGNNNLPSTVCDLESGGKLLWIGSKRTDKVLIYCPGGAFLLPVQFWMLSFWRYAQLEWRKQGIEVGIVVLSYSVVPVGVFPAQLRQACSALEYLLAAGVNLSDLQIAGDSAGGNLVAQVLSHMLHPHPSVAPLNFPPDTRLRGAYMMSPWVCLSDYSASAGRKNRDILTIEALSLWGRVYLSKVPESQVVYAEPGLAPDGWYTGLDNAVERVLVTTGSEECFEEQDVAFFEKKIRPHHSDATLCVQDGGVHDDPMLDFFVTNRPLGNGLTPTVLQWIAAGFQS